MSAIKFLESYDTDSPAGEVKQLFRTLSTVIRLIIKKSSVVVQELESAINLALHGIFRSLVNRYGLYFCIALLAFVPLIMVFA